MHSIGPFFIERYVKIIVCVRDGGHCFRNGRYGGIAYGKHGYHDGGTCGGRRR